MTKVVNDLYHNPPPHLYEDEMIDFSDRVTLFANPVISHLSLSADLLAFSSSIISY